MNQAPTSPGTAELLPLAAAATTTPTPTAATAPGFATATTAERPRAARGRYWEQLDPASKSLYPVD